MAAGGKSDPGTNNNLGNFFIGRITDVQHLRCLPAAGAGNVLSHGGRYNFMGKAARTALKIAPRALVYNRFNAWGKSREMPTVPEESFKEWYEKHRR